MIKVIFSFSIRSIAWLSIVIVCVISLLSIVGMIFDISFFKSVHPHWVPMRLAVALCLIFSAFILGTMLEIRNEKRKKIISITGGALLVVTGLITVAVYITNFGTNQDTFINKPSFFRFLFSPIYRAAFLAAFLIFFTGAVLILLGTGKRTASDIAHAITLLIFIISYIIPINYILGVYSFPEFMHLPVAMNTGIAFCALGIAIFCVNPNTWFMKVFTDRYAGSEMTRKLIPGLIFIPLFIDFLRLLGEKYGVLNPEGSGIFVVSSYTFFLVFLVWRNAKSINQKDELTQKSAEISFKNEQRLKYHFENSPLGVVEWNYDFIVTQWSGQAERIFGWNQEEIIGKRIDKLGIIYEEDIPVVSHTMERLSGGIENIVVATNRNYTKHGSVIECTWYNSVLLDETGKIVSVMSLIDDITERRNAEETLKKYSQKLEILSETAANLLSSDDPQKILDDLCKKVMEFLDCQVFFNYVSDQNSEKLHLNAFAGIPDEAAAKIEWLNYGVAVCGCVAMEGQRIVSENIMDSEDIRTTLVKSLGIKAYACHPLINNGSVMGTLSFGTLTRNKFTDDDLNLMKIISDQVAVSMGRMRDKEMLARSEERYRKLVEISPYAVFINRNNKIVYANPTALQLFGAPDIGHIFGKSPFQFFHPEGHAIISQRIKEVLTNKTVHPIELKIIRTDGTIIDAEVTGSKFTDQEGVATQVVLQNISERKHAQAIMKRYKLITQHARDPLLLAGPQGEIVEANYAAEKFYGYSRDTLLTLNVKDISNENVETISTREKEALMHGVLYETTHIRKEGNVVPVEVSSRGVVIDGKKMILSIIRDITERKKIEKELKESKEKLHLALENGNIGIWFWDLVTNVIEWDERMEKIFGLQPGSFDKTYSTFEKFIVDEDLQHTTQAIKKSLEDNAPLETVYRIKTAGDEIKYISAKGLVTKDEQDKPVKMSGVCLDITTMKKGTERTLFKLNEELLRSNKELELFAYVASHDLQEPLRMVSSFTQLLAQRYGDKLDENAKEFIHFAVDGANRMQLLINDLLSFSRIQTKGKNFSIVDMHVILGQVLLNLNLRIQEKKAVITTDDLPLVNVDEVQIAQLLQNLIANAIKFSKTNPHIHISSKEENNHYVFSVKDNGIGIEKQYFDRIFQIFQRLQPKDEFEGTGIGLAICKRIIERHKGKIWVESEIGKGSTFYFTLTKP